MVFEKARLTSPPQWKFPSPNVTEKPKEIHLILIQSKIPLACM